MGCNQLFVHYAVILNTGNISEQDQSMAVRGRVHLECDGTR